MTDHHTPSLVVGHSFKIKEWCIHRRLSVAEYFASDRDRSAIYVDLIPLFTSGCARLLDDRKLVGQLAALERRTTSGRDKVDHPRGAHDDVANAAAGALVMAADRRHETRLVTSEFIGAFTATRPGFGDETAEVHRAWQRTDGAAGTVVRGLGALSLDEQRESMRRPDGRIDIHRHRLAPVKQGLW